MQFLQLGAPLAFPLNLSLYCFAVSMPLMAALVVVYTLEIEFGVTLPQRLSWFLTYVGIAGSMASYAGVGGLFWYFSFPAFGVFLAISAIALSCVSYFIRSELR